jgi:hypothetical protein
MYKVQSQDQYTNMVNLSEGINSIYPAGFTRPMAETLQLVYTTNGGKRPRENDSQAEGPQVGPSSSKGKTKAQRRPPQALIGPSVAVKELLNMLRVEMCLPQLIDISPKARTEIASLLKLTPVEKGPKAPKRPKVNLAQPTLSSHLAGTSSVGQPGHPRQEINLNCGHHDDMIRPMDRNTVLFFTEAEDNVTTRSKPKLYN